MRRSTDQGFLHAETDGQGPNVFLKEGCVFQREGRKERDREWDWEKLSLLLGPGRYGGNQVSMPWQTLFGTGDASLDLLGPLGFCLGDRPTKPGADREKAGGGGCSGRSGCGGCCGCWIAVSG